MGIFNGKAKRIYNEAMALYEKGDLDAAEEKMDESADLGYVEAMYQLGNIYVDKGLEGCAARNYDKAAKKHHKEAKRKLKELCVDSYIRNTYKEYHLDRELERWAKNGGPAHVQFAFAEMLYYDGRESPENESDAKKEERKKSEIEEALEWAKKSAAQGYAEGHTLCGSIYRLWKNDTNTALKWYKTGGELGDKEAYYWGGRAFFSIKKYEEAAEWYLKGWNMGHEKCPEECIYSYGWIGTIEGQEKALELYNRYLTELQQKKWYTKTHEIDKHTAIAMKLIGHMYYRAGEKQVAYGWYQRSLNQDFNYDLEEQCANMCYKGDGIEKNYEEAYRLYSDLASRFENMDIIYQCGKMNLFGEGTPVNEEKAFEYFNQMEKRADYRGRYLCIYMYYFGIGVREDQDKAHELLQYFRQFDTKQEEWLKECEERGYPWKRLKVKTETYWVYADED